MSAVLETSLALWGFDVAETVLIAQRENSVFRVSTGSATYAMRLHCPGYQSAAEILSEVE